MSTHRTIRTLLLPALMVAAAACGGSEDHIATRTVELDGRTIELVAEFPASTPRHEVDAVLLKVDLSAVRDLLAGRSTGDIVDPSRAIHIGAYPHDDADAEEAVAHFTKDGKDCGAKCEAESPEDDAVPLGIHAKDIDQRSVRAATDPDVDPAAPY